MKQSNSYFKAVTNSDDQYRCRFQNWVQSQLHYENSQSITETRVNLMLKLRERRYAITANRRQTRWLSLNSVITDNR